MSSLPPSPVMGLHNFDTDDAMVNLEVNENTALIDTLPPTVCTSVTRPATDLYTGRLIYETDSKRVMIWDGNSWERVDEGELLPAPVRGYFVNSNKVVTATAWADIANDNAKSITLAKAAMCNVIVRAIINGVAATALTVRLAWTGATTGNSYDQMDSAVLGAMGSNEAAKREFYSLTVKLNAGTTTFKLQGQRSNTSNSVSIDAGAISITPFEWGDKYVGGAT